MQSRILQAMPLDINDNEEDEIHQTSYISQTIDIASKRFNIRSFPNLQHNLRLDQW